MVETLYSAPIRNARRASCVSCHWHGVPSARRARETCPRCGGATFVKAGTYALLPWRGDGSYRLEQAVKTYASEIVADRAAHIAYEASDPRGLVVRFIARETN